MPYLKNRTTVVMVVALMIASAVGYNHDRKRVLEIEQIAEEKKEKALAIERLEEELRATSEREESLLEEVEELKRANSQLKKERPREQVSRGGLHVPRGIGGFKSYMDYKAITNRRSSQYKLQQQAYTCPEGFRKVDDRFLIALGSYYTTNIGEKVNVTLESGEVLKCMLGDSKADIHTDSNNQIRYHGGTANLVEFIVDNSALKRSEGGKMIRRMGDASFSKQYNLSGEVVKIEVIK